MGLQGVSAPSRGPGTRVIFTFRPVPGVSLGGVVTHQRRGNEDAAAFKSALDAQAVLQGLDGEMPEYWIHINVTRNPGTVAVGTGEEPAVWPEDEVGI